MLDLLSFTAIYAIPSFLVVLTLIVTIHELGHFWAARACGVAVDRFSIGFGKAIFARTDKSGVEWRIGWIPLGGYVRFAGDSNDASVPDSNDLAHLKAQIIEKHGAEAVQRFYHFKPVWQRAIIAAAGPFANFLLAFIVFSALLLSVARDVTPPVVGAVGAETPAAAAGFQPGDRIVRANRTPIRTYNDLKAFNIQNGGSKVAYQVERGGESLMLTARLAKITSNDPVTGLPLTRGILGLTSDPALAKWEKAHPSEVPGEAFDMVRDTIEAPIRYVGRIFAGLENGDQISGIIGIATTSGKLTEKTLNPTEGKGSVAAFFLYMVQLTAFLSVAIGFVNLLPIPVLDGGHLMFYAYEAVARRPVGARIQEASYKVGLALVLGLMLFATWNDLQRLQAFKFIGDLFS